MHLERPSLRRRGGGEEPGGSRELWVEEDKDYHYDDGDDTRREEEWREDGWAEGRRDARRRKQRSRSQPGVASENWREFDFELINEAPVEDVTLDFFYKPHTLTALFVLIAALMYTALTTDDSQTDVNALSGLKALSFFFLLVSALTFPNGPFTRPHPLLWRCVFGLSILYLMMLQFTLFQKKQDIKAVMSWLDSEGLSHETLEEKEYAVNCSQISLERIWEHMDVFAFGHFFGWAMKAILIRHGVLCWYISMTWELTELTFAHLLPNFLECWWDAWILDVLICNGLGIALGLAVTHWLNARIYHWESIRDIKSVRGKIKRCVMQFTPWSWSEFSWQDAASTRNRVAGVAAFVVVWHITELNTFFLKHIFAVDTAHPLVVGRILLFGAISAPTIRQFYGFCTDPLVNRLGTQCWVYVAIMLSESAICLKFGRDLFAQTRLELVAGWLFGLCFGCYFVVRFSSYYARVSGQTLEVVGRNGELEHRFHDASTEDLLQAVKRDSIKNRRRKFVPTTTQSESDK